MLLERHIEHLEVVPGSGDASTDNLARAKEADVEGVAFHKKGGLMIEESAPTRYGRVGAL